MASAHSLEEQFQCSICLDVFVEPVSTPCGHNFCQRCITGCWVISGVSRCPLCQETFTRTPELRVNTEFRDILELFKKARAGSDGGGGGGAPADAPAGPQEVACDVCSEGKRKAVKSCLVCLASYCSAHLKPHHTGQALKWHQLIGPVASLEDRACRKHNKLKEFFCRTDQSCVCSACFRDEHVEHEVVSLEEELKERKTQLRRVKRKVEKTLKNDTIRAHAYQNSIKHGRQEVEKLKAETVRSFAALVALIETKKEKLLELLEEKQRAAEQQSAELLRQLQLEIAAKQKVNAELEELSQTEDEFRLLQSLPSAASSSISKHFLPKDQRLQHSETLRRTLENLKETLNDQLDGVIREVRLRKDEESPEFPTFDDALGKLQDLYLTEVTLDPDTAHPSLVVSEDRTRVKDGVFRRRVPDNPSRFDCLHLVLGKEGFSSGRFYFEVLLEGQNTWEVGVTRESIQRKGAEVSLSPENGCWTLGSYWGRCQANANPPVILPKKPESVGVFVDYEGGSVSFYDLDARAQIYSFTRCIFTAGTSPGGFFHQIYTGFVTKSRIYPIFRPSSEAGVAPLQIPPL
ncbi:E3 ubiquitin-protein ligase TRIM39-like isoform 1-T2 [Odontesthes bonariensis]|uniref:E3 ubiquitin-protein ligase TRIM39-like n=1 Tax=Odontesthes bonariensis TaxID=219752 RepID=UPI003F5891B2